MIRWAAVLALCGGCNLVLGLREFDHDAAMIDVAPDVGPPARCSAMTMLADSFDSDNLATRWPGALSVSVTGGKAVLSPLDNGYAILDSNLYYDLREGEFSITLSDDGRIAPGESVEIDLYSTRANYALQIVRADGNIAFHRIEAGTPSSLGSATYDPAGHTHIRVTRDGTTTAFETSADGIGWTPVVALDGLDYVGGFVRVRVAAYRPPGGAAYDAYIEDINGGTPSGTACKLSTLRDTFDAPPLAEQWARSSAYGGSVTVTGGRLQLDAAALVSTSLTVATATLYDARDDQLVFEVPQMLDPATTNGLQFVAELSTFAGTAATYLVIEDGQNHFQEQKDIPQLMVTGLQPYVAANARWWRLRVAANIVYWEISANGVDWGTPLAVANDIPGLDQVEVTFLVSGTPGTARTIQIDNLDAPP